MPRIVLTALCFAFTVFASAGGPPSADDARRQAATLDQLKRSLAAEPAVPAKFALLTRMLAGESNVDVRRRVLEVAAEIPDAALDPVLTPVLADDADAGIRSQAATLLGRRGSEKCLAVLAKAAAEDKTTDVEIGCVRGRSSARRAATFAVAELAARHPRLAADAAAELRALPATVDPKDNESLGDARTQALYQVTRDETLLKPFHDRLKSPVAKDRESGVIAFRFLKLKVAPPELVATSKDPSADVRLWTGLVLGEIGDPKTGDALMALAGNAKEDAGVRCNGIAALGRMKHAAAAELLRKLTADGDPTVAACAVAALARLADEKP